MTFGHIPPAAAVFLDANTLIYHFGNEPTYGAACTQLIQRVELGGLAGFTSAHALADVAHRLMTLEAMNRNGWPQAGLAARLKKRHDQIPPWASISRPSRDCRCSEFKCSRSPMRPSRLPRF